MENEELAKQRHSLAHILAAAVRKLYPQTKFAIGPAIENGFYYDFDLGDATLSSHDLTALEKEMKKIIAQDLEFKKTTLPLKEALIKEKEKGQIYKQELLEDLEKQGETEVSYYTVGDFTDLCKGPHVTNTKELKKIAFCLTKTAGAYWRGSEKNKMLTRIYGLAFSSSAELQEYQQKLKEAEERDHRKLGKKLELFMVSEEVGKGLIMFLPKGAFLRRKLEDYMYQKEFEYGYKYVVTPVLTREEMYRRSGHLAHYKDDMYSPLDIEGENYYLKPMNCPHHHIMYKNKPKSYRDLPLRFADFGIIHRYERSGVLNGLIRTRNFSQNDAHIYCAKKQVKEEFIKVLKLFQEVYQDFQIKDYWFRLSLPDYNNKEKYGDIENKEMWEYSANIAREAMQEFGVPFEEVEGEAAFYGPKIDVQIKNVFGKEDTIATIQVDFYMPERFDLKFINREGKEERPVIIHRAIMGSFERFMAFLIEKTGGNFPVWLSPVQAKLISVSEKYNSYGQKLEKIFRQEKLRVELDLSDETVGKKIRKAQQEKVPYLLVVGEREEKNQSVSVRRRGEKETKEMPLAEFIKQIKKEEAEKK